MSTLCSATLSAYAPPKESHTIDRKGASNDFVFCISTAEFPLAD